jgi:multiple sugar transport system substrate-binding protein
LSKKRLWSALAMAGVTMGGLVAGLSTSVSAATGGNITVAYFQQTTNPALPYILNQAKATFEKAYPGWTVTLEGITSAGENDYYTKLDLMSSSASTAPDVLYEDTFLVNSDVSAGYLAPIDSYLKSWSQWSDFFPSAKAAARGTDGHIYGVPMGTDTRGLWYNKILLAKAGIKLPWHPTTWAQVIAAAQAIKKAEPGIIPLNVYGGVGAGEGTSMQGFEMLLYGTTNPLYDTKTNKWEKAGSGWKAVLSEYKTIYGQDLGPTPQTEVSTQILNEVWDTLIPQGKLAIALDGSWLPGIWAPNGGAPWPQWSTTMAETAMPTEYGQGPGKISLSGGWLLSVGSHAANKQMAFNYIADALNYKNSLYYSINGGQIAVRSDVAAAPSYKKSNASIATMSSFVTFTHYRPAYSVYPKLSDEIQVITGQVLTGQLTPSAGAAEYNKYLVATVGASNTEPAPS